MTRALSEKIRDRNQPLLEKIKRLKSAHPFWGYRRIWAYLTYVDKLRVNKKRIYRLLKLHGLIVTKNTRLRAKRSIMRPKPKAEQPNQVWGIDMTKFKTSKGWSYLVVVLDWYSKKIVGHHLGGLSRSIEWLEALEMGLNQQFRDGVRNMGLKLVSDNGCQPTSGRFMKSCNELGIKQIFTSYNNPKGNAETERMMRTIKEELIWLREWNNEQEVKEALEGWVRDYNRNYLHSALGYRSPAWAEENYQAKTAA